MFSIDKSTNTPIGIEEWGKKNLTPENFNKLLLAQQRQANIIEAAGISFEPITEKVFSPTLNAEIIVEIGQKVTAPGELPQGDAEYLEFEAMFAKDPNILYHVVAEM
jgi:hypothetical protein